MTLEDLKGQWAGQVVACIASGPSLTADDCEAIRAAGLRCIVTNTSFRLAPWADVLYAMDQFWWREYAEEVSRSFNGIKLSLSSYAQAVVSTKNRLFPPGHGNSGSYAISAAVVFGASRIILLGYDCKFDAQGRKHWHADHPGTMGNAASIKRWPYQFEMVATYAASRGVDVVNCSRDTALGCFTRGVLEEELQRVAA